ncbi:MAG TPA: TetR/AcrR family transcriptional regulator [Polyangiaceae bacterium]|nr:TetR/AcrR family transcriptional regulator [Polyangiaceae bacterium]
MPNIKRPSKANGVRPRRTGYHHGDLRRALLEATLQLVATNGPEGFTLRAAAKLAQVSDAAPYHHFADKEALLASVAEEGFQKLHAELEQAGNGASDAEERARAMGVAYVLFAVNHPSHFRVMVTRPLAQQAKHVELAKTAAAAFNLVRDALISAVGERQLQRVPAEQLIYTSWALVHGLAFLAIDGHLGPIAQDSSRLGPFVHAILSAQGADKSCT